MRTPSIAEFQKAQNFLSNILSKESPKSINWSDYPKGDMIIKGKYDSWWGVEYKSTKKQDVIKEGWINLYGGYALSYSSSNGEWNVSKNEAFICLLDQIENFITDLRA